MIYRARLWLAILGAGFFLSWSAQGAERNPQVQKAIDRGVAFVRSKQGQNGAWTYPGVGAGTDTGATALVGLTLLECGAPASDPQVQQAAFVWSMERVAEIYGLKTIGRRDWYAWGSNVLLNSQSEDGGWYGRYHPSGVDTCFALLFLVRANVAKDLSVTLRGKMRDPATRTLKGGVVLDAAKKKGDKTAESSDKKSANPDTPKLTDPKDKLPANHDGDSPGDRESNDPSSARRMSDDLASASDAQQNELLMKYKEGKGPNYTQALAGAIPRLKGDNKSKARDALAERLTRMTADTLRAQLKDDDPEIRRAAALACAMKDDKSHVPDLIPLLDDAEPLVGRAAHAALKSLSNQDYGPAKDAPSKDRAQAIDAWKDWWAKQERK
jgi:hypothetical protein